jgi:hypothetical protein
MAAIYAYAEGDGPIPDELVLARSIKQYGAEAIFGRTLSFHEVRMITLAENIYNAYQERQRSENWAVWAHDNPKKAELLGVAGRLYAEESGE